MNNYYIKNFIYLLAIAMTMGFTACSSDDDEDGKKPEEQKEQYINSDLIGWWICRWIVDGNARQYLAIHFIDDQVAVWYGDLENTQAQGGTYTATIDGEKFYADDYYTRRFAYIRDGNVITFSGGGTFTIIDGKIYWEQYDFVKDDTVISYTN